MKFTTTQKELNTALSFVASAIERKTTLPVMANVLIACKDGVATFSGTNSSVEKRSSIGVNVIENGSITVPATKFLDFAKTASPNKDINIELKENNVILSSGRSKWKLSTIPSLEFPEFMSIDNSESLSIDINTLVDGIKRCSVSMAVNDTRYYLNGMLFDIKKGMLTLVSTDGHRMITYKIECNASFERQVIISRNAVLDILKMIGKSRDVSIEIGSNSVKISSDGNVMYTTIIDGKFPDYDRVVPKNNPITVSVNSEEIRNAIKRTMPISEGVNGTKPLKLNISNGELSITASNKQNEKAVEVMPIGFNGDDFEIGFNGTYLSDAVNATTSDNINIDLKDSNSSAKIDEGSMTAVIMPVRF